MAALENVQRVDTVTETEDKTSGDDGGQERREDFGQDRRDPLQRILVLFRGLLDLILGDAGDTGYFYEIFIEFRDCVADDDLELSGLGEGTLNDLHGLDAGDIRLGRICQDEVSYSEIRL